MQLQDHIQSSALFLPDNPETVWLFTDTNEISTLYSIVDSALRQRPEFRLVIAVPRNELPELRRRFPHEQFVALPSDSGRIRPSRYSQSTLQILGAKYHQLAGTLSHSLKVEGDFDIHTILRLLPDATFAGADPGSSTPASCLIRLLAGSAIVQLNDLRLRLGTPRHILCLGNGPSSEDTRLQGCSFDCLFRVNWIWRDRGLYLNPNLVFTADIDRPFGSPRPIIAFPSRLQGLPIIRRHCLLLRPPRRGYLFADEILSTLKDRGDPVTPSNGAIMVAVAAALQPERIAIAGIDLYSHDQGRYPGDKDAIDGYSRNHSRTTDLEFIRSALSSYRGNLEILSEGLLRELKATTS